MGAWGDGPFDNNAAADWAGEFDGADRRAGLQAVRSALLAAVHTGPDDYLDGDDSAVAVAAAEIVAAIYGLEVAESAYNEDALSWVATTIPPANPDLAPLAVQALDRITAPQSELAELWSEADDPSWRQTLDARLASLRGLPQP